MSANIPMTCAEVRGRIALFLYGDLDTDQAAGVSAHLDACSECRLERDAQAEARGALSAWSALESPADVAAIAQSASAAAVRERASLRRPAVVGLAAGIVAFVALSFVGARIERGVGVVSLVFGRGTAESPSSVATRDVVANEVARQLDDALVQLGAVADGLDSLQQQRLADLVRAIRMENERDEIADSIRARQLMDGVVQAVAFRVPPPHRP